MRTGLFAAAFSGLILFAALAGCAVDPEARIHVTGMVSFIDDDADRDTDDNLAGYHIGVGKSLGDKYMLEATLVGSRLNADGFDNDQHQTGLGLDVLRKLGSSEYFYPYAVFGVGHLQTDTLAPGRQDYNGPMVSLGVGVITPVYVMGQALRVEMRLRNDSGDTAGERYQDALLSIGLHFPLGQPAKIKRDADGDGVEDDRDRCEGTQAGLQVDRYGCARDRDSDNDGVSDALDMCGGTQAGRVVDEYGCERIEDADADGVPDYRDRCPDSPSGARVDKDGCPRSGTTSLPRMDRPAFLVSQPELTGQREPRGTKISNEQFWPTVGTGSAVAGLAPRALAEGKRVKDGPFTLSYALSFGRIASRSEPTIQRIARL